MADGEDRTRELEAEVAVLRAMLAAAPAFISRLTTDGRFIYANRFAGFAPVDVVGAPVSAFLGPEETERLADAVRRVVDSGTTVTFEAVAPSSPENVGRYVARVSPIVEDGVVTSLVMVATDVTALAEARDRLRESRAQLQVALDATGMGIWTYDAATDQGTWDDRARAVFGVEDGDAAAPGLAGMLEAMIHPEDRERVERALQLGLKAGSYGPIEHRIITPAGATRWVAAGGSRVNGARDGSRLVGTVVDITERRAVEARLLEAEKLDSIGRLAGGIAHDFNNMLTAMNVNVELLLRGASDDRQRSMLREIRHAADRSATLTKQLLAFARRQIIAPKVIDPNELVRRIDALLRRVLGEHIDTAAALDAQRRVRVDPTQLEQMLLNLATNARDAMPTGGRLTLETADVLVDETRAAQMEVTPGPYVRITVRDTGRGIVPEVLPHVFEPFYTSRAGATGLGLATCYGIAKQSFGHIAVDSTPGRGTTVDVYLPAHEGPTDQSGLGGGREQAARPDGECILVAEDEDLVRTVVCRTLETAGYRVRAAAEPNEAIQVFAGGGYDMLVTDVVMPGMDGRQLAARLREVDPALPVLFISGYSDTVIQAGEPLGPGMRFLQKPFSSQALLSAVRELLDARPKAESAAADAPG